MSHGLPRNRSTRSSAAGGSPNGGSQNGRGGPTPVDCSDLINASTIFGRGPASTGSSRDSGTGPAGGVASRPSMSPDSSTVNTRGSNQVPGRTGSTAPALTRAGMNGAELKKN